MQKILSYRKFITLGFHKKVIIFAPIGVMIPIFILVCWSSVAFAKCPPAESIAPACFCGPIGNEGILFCKNMLSPEELISPIKAVITSKSDLFSFVIMNSSLMYIPHDLLKETTFEKIQFINSEVMSLSDSDDAFVGLEDTMTEIRASGAHFIAQWDWQQLRNLKKLKLIDVNWISMQSIPEPFPELPNLSSLGILRAEIDYIDDHAFQNLPQLTLLIMKENNIKELKRSMFPDPALHLELLDFSHNQLMSLPTGFFLNMPSLDYVRLDYNNFLTLDENVFSQVMPRLQDLTLTGNKLVCDCRLRWIVGGRVPQLFNAPCSSPPSLKGTQIRKIDLKSLWC